MAHPVHAWLCSSSGGQITKTLLTEHLDLSMIPSLVDTTLNTLDDTILPSANWVLELLDNCELLQKVAGIKVTMADITMLQDQSDKPCVAHLKGNISSRFASSSEVVSAMSNFDPWKAQTKYSTDCQYGTKYQRWHRMVNQLAENLSLRLISSQNGRRIAISTKQA